MNIAIIPARGGSKRIPKKNIRSFQGKPMLQLTIEKLVSFEIFDAIYVSTEDPTISKLALESGVRIHEREVTLSDDFTSTLDVMFSAVNHLQALNLNVDDIVSCIYPVTPLLELSHLNKAFLILEEIDGGYVFAGQDQSSQIGRSFFINEKAELEMLFPDREKMRTQDLSKVYSDAGLFYMGKASTWMSRIPIFSQNSKFIELGRYETVDIDTEEDWKFAEELFAVRSKTSVQT